MDETYHLQLTLNRSTEDFKTDDDLIIDMDVFVAGARKDIAAILRNLGDLLGGKPEVTLLPSHVGATQQGRLTNVDQEIITASRGGYWNG